MKWFRMLLILPILSLFLMLTSCGNSSSSNDSHESAWKSARLIADSARFPRIGVDGNGNVFTVWAQTSGVWAQPTELYANLFTMNSGWGTPRKIGESNAGWSAVRLVVSKNGYAIAVWWNEEFGTVSDVQAVRYVAGAGWGAVESLGNIGVPKDVAINDAGDAFVVTESSTESMKGLTIARYDHAIGWTNDRIAYTDTSTNHGFPKISVDDSGYGFVLWVEGESGINNVYVSRRFNAEWEEPKQIASIAGMYNPWTNIKIDSNGNAMALWGQMDSSSLSHTYACHYTAANGWGKAQRIDTSLSDSIDQYLAVDPSGNFFAVWTQSTDTAVSTILCSRYSPAIGWLAARLVGTGTPARTPRVAADSSGSVFAAWQQYDPDDVYPGDAGVYASRFTAASGWGAQRQLRNVPGGADDPELAVDPSGRATVIWSQSMASSEMATKYGVFYSRFE